MNSMGAAAAFAGEGLHPHPVADVLDHGIGMDQVEALVGVFAKIAGVAHHGREQRVVHRERLRVEQADPDLVRLQEGAVEQDVPIGRLASQIGDPALAALGEGLVDQGDHAGRAGPPKARRQRLVAVHVLEGVDQFHAASLSQAA